MRARGVVVTRPETTFSAEDAKRILAERNTRRVVTRPYPAAPPPNWKCYLNIVFFIGKNIDEKGRWIGKGKLPPCNRCHERIHPQEHHKCEGYVPKYETWSDERKERAEARREEIRQSRVRNPIVCSICGEEMPEPEDGEAHWDAHEGRPERLHYALGDEHDGDLDGYEDEPEEDYCEGDDDGYDCD